MVKITMVEFSIFDAIGNDNPVPIPDYTFEDWISKSNNNKLQVQQQPTTKSNHELTAAQTNTQTEKYFSIYDTISLV
jgi:hypothetical protein